MIRRRCKLALFCVPVLAAVGCQPQPPPVVLDTRGVQPAANYGHLAQVLAAAVKKNGLVDPDGLRHTAAALDAQLKLLAVTGPTATPGLFATQEDALAYWYNARAAWSMKLLLLEGCPRQLEPSRHQQRRFPLDGRAMSLAGIDEVLRRDGDFRTVVSAPGATIERARLPEKPFEPQAIRQRIAERFAELIDDDIRFVIDIRGQRIWVPAVLWQFREPLIRAHNARYATEGATLTTALLAYLSGSPHRRLQDAIGYRLVEARSGMLNASVEED